MHWKADPLLYPSHLRARVKRGRGLHQGAEYLPWLYIRDVPSRGTSLGGHGIVTGRTHQGLSDLEATYLYLMERRKSVVDIREQWPILDLDRTLELCTELEVRHIYKRGLPEPVTIDFLITELTANGKSYRAASVKSSEDAADPSKRLRLEVEHRWCQERGIPWTLVDTSRFNKTLLEILRFMRGWFRHCFNPETQLDPRFLLAFESFYKSNELLSELVARLTKTLRLPNSQVLDMFRYCAWSGQIDISLGHPLALNRPLFLNQKKR